MNAQTITPAPWHIKGSGIILMYYFRKDFVHRAAFLSNAQKSAFTGGFGYVMLVNYQESPVGPYKELLFIPGKFKIGKKKRQTISKIYVDSELSLQSGRANWGIPKELAHFEWIETGNKIDVSVSIGDGGEPFFNFKATKRRIPLPLTTSILPIRLHQKLNDKEYNVTPTGKGMGCLIKTDIGEIDADYFPDVAECKPLLAAYVNPFQMYFP